MSTTINGTTGINRVEPTAHGLPLSHRNKIINGKMEISQRGTSFSTGVGVLTYTLDRWIVAANGAALAVSQGAQASEPYNYMAIDGAAGNTAWSIRQRIESKNIRDLAGKTVTISFYLYNATGNASNASVVVYSADATDNFSTATLVAQQSVNLATSNRQSFTLTLSAACANGIELQFYSGSAFTSGAMVLHTVQLEPGSVATPFEHRPYGTELALCQRYYQKVAIPVYTVSANATSSWFFKVPMRATPTISGGGAGFTNQQVSSEAWAGYQTTLAIEVLTASSEL